MSSTRKKHKVFVYGTLRPKGVEATHCIDGWQLFNYYDRFPYIKQGEGSVVGTVVEVTDRQLKEFDLIEGIAHGLFKRVSVEAFVIQRFPSPVREGVKAFVYMAGNITPAAIQSGDWFNRD